MYETISFKKLNAYKVLYIYIYIYIWLMPFKVIHIKGNLSVCKIICLLIWIGLFKCTFHT